MIIEQDHGYTQTKKFFFGVEDVEWAPIILDMFSRKLDELYIRNQFHEEYLSKNSYEMLVKV